MINDYSLLFFSYISVADGSIHDKSIVIINEYMKQNEVSENDKSEMYKILGDEDDAVPLAEILLTIKDYDKNKILEILYIALKIILLDGYISKSEQNILNKFKEVNNILENEYKDIIEKVEKDIKEEEKALSKENQLGFIDNVKKNALAFFKNIPIKNIREDLEKRYNNFLLNGPEYSQAINKTSQIAKVDLEESKKYLEKSKENLLKLDEELDNALIKIMKSIKKENSHTKETNIQNSEEEIIIEDKNKSEFEEGLKSLKNDISRILNTNIKELEEAIEKKERALKYYSISFIGKTKAGKSTLHSIITGTGDEFIGVGKQRTTRFNRIYEWKNIRIIDTPGIGAPGGKSDEEIAKSIIDESDLICYVLKNDSVQESEFNFLKLIKERNKPIVILLNVKENIENDTRLKIFLKDPEKWYTRTDEKSLQGHINRIKNYADKHYNNGYFEIFPIQMLAAKMSKDEKYSEYQKVLYKSSHIQDFLDNIRMQIMDEGIIKRTQTMIDGSIYIINDINNILLNNMDKLYKMNSKFKENKEILLKKLEKSYEDNLKVLRESLISEFKDLKDNKALDFASKYYDEKDDVGYYWKKYLEKIKFNDKIKNKFEESFNEYKLSLEEYLKEFSEDMELFSKMNMGNFSFDMSGTFNTRGLVRIIGSSIGAIGATLLVILGTSNPVGWVISGIGLVVGLLGGLFKSKQKKIQEATDKLYNSIRNNIKENEDKHINDICNNFTNAHKDIIKKIDSSINNLCKYLDSIHNDLRKINHEIAEDLAYLNKVYAYRIINYANKKEIIEIDREKLNQITVSRNYGESIKITSPYNFNKNTEDIITKVIQEKVIFEKIK